MNSACLPVALDRSVTLNQFTIEFHKARQSRAEKEDSPSVNQPVSQSSQPGTTTSAVTSTVARD